MKPKETINLYRVISLLVIALVTFGVMGGLGAKSHLYPDEWLSMFFLTLIFLLVCMFELEYERKQKGISANTQTTFIRLSVTYTVSGGLIYAISYLPEFYRPVMIPVILLTAVSNSMVAVSFGLFFDLVLALTVGGSFYALAAYMMLTMLAAVLAQALKEKKYRMGVYFLFQSDDSGTVFLFINERNAEIFAALCFWNSIPDFSDSSFSVSPAAS